MSLEKAARFKEVVERLVAEASRAEAPDAPIGYTGEVIEATLEHTVRVRFLDHLLSALGWKVETTVEEARVKGDTTLFLDYVGVHLDTRVPVLIFEAKAWEKPFVSAARAAGKKQRSEELIARTLKFIKEGQEDASPVTGEWTGWLAKLVDYARDLKNQSKNVVSRVAISSGQWLVVFTDPHSAFLDPGDVDPTSILVFEMRDYVRDSDHLFGHLSYGRLVADIPSPLRPTQLTAFVSARAVSRVFRAMWVRWETSGSKGMLDTFPQILVYPAAVVERSDGALLHIADKYGRSFVPPDASHLKGHVEEVQRNSDQLLEVIWRELGQNFTISDLAVFPGFPSTPLRGSVLALVPESEQSRVQFIKPWPNQSGEFLLVTGVSAHFLLEAPTVASCIGHDWAACSGAGHPAGQGPIVSSSVDPKSFYISGSSHHCAHRGIHDRRSGKCYVAAFEAFLCCKACIFQQTCWPVSSTPALPCGAPTASVGAAMRHGQAVST